MTKQLSAIIAKYINSETRLIIPEVGTLLRRKESGEVVFTEMLRKNDGVLVGLVVNGMDVSPSRANEIVGGYVEVIKQELATRKKFILDGVGVLLRRADGGVDFSFNPFAQSIPEPDADEDDSIVPLEEVAVSQPSAPRVEVATAPRSVVTPKEQPVVAPNPAEEKPAAVRPAVEPAKPAEVSQQRPAVAAPKTTPKPTPTEAVEEEAPRGLRIRAHHAVKKIDGITILALVAVVLALMALVWGMIPAGDRDDVNVEQPAVEAVENSEGEW